MPASKPEYEDSSVAINAILESKGISAEARVDGLVGLWVKSKGRDSLPLSVACEQVPREKARELFDRITILLESPEMDREEAPKTFFYGGAATLAGKVMDPEPLLRSALSHGCWEGLPWYDCAPELKQDYILQGLARAEKTRRWIAYGDSLVDCFGQDSKPQLRRIVHDLREKASWAGFRIAVQALSEMGDTTIVPDLEYAVNHAPLQERDRWFYELLLVRARAQNDSGELIKVLENEKTNPMVMDWAVQRALRLKVSRAKIGRALRDNGSPVANSYAAINVPRETSHEPPACGQGAADNFNPLVLDADEVKYYRRSMRRPGGGIEFAKNHRFSVLLGSAPAND